LRGRKHGTLLAFQELRRADVAVKRKAGQGEIEMFKVEDEIAESALCIGIIAALIWGVALSLYGFHQPPGEVSWTAWGVQLLGGVVACLIVPLAFVRGRGWVLARVQR
jgi:hypothetical protein